MLPYVLVLMATVLNRMRKRDKLIQVVLYCRIRKSAFSANRSRVGKIEIVPALFELHFPDSQREGVGIGQRE